MGYNVYKWEGDTTQRRDSFTWKSKKYLMNSRKRFSAARVIFESTDLSAYYASVLAYNEAIERNRARLSVAVGIIGGLMPGEDISLGGDVLEAVPSQPVYAGDDSLTIKVYVDGTLRKTKTITNTKAFKIGAQRRGRVWEFELIGNVVVKQFGFADSVEELALMGGQQNG